MRNPSDIPADAAGIAVPDAASLVALRHRAREIHLFPRQRALASQGGHYRSAFRGRGMEFDEVRAYQPGDDIRTIDWRVTARTNSTHTKVFREERERPVLIAADLRGPMFFGSRRLKSMVAAEIATLLAWAGVNANDRVGALVFGDSRQWDSRSKRSHHSVLRVVQHLVEACTALLTEPEPDADTCRLETILEDCRRVTTPGTSLVLVSDFHDLNSECEKHLYELARHCDVTLCWVYDPLEAELPPPGLYAVSGDDGVVTLNSRNEKARQQFRQLFDQRREKLKACANRFALQMLECPTDTAVIEPLRAAFGGRQRRGQR
ncbi:MAG: DUF58 domain-containing protein [Porticoccaceae bacterium]|nr:DUF58 domain-containing protein [Porticoccaceae bacterium]